MKYLKGMFQFSYDDLEDYNSHKQILESIGFKSDGLEEQSDGTWIGWFIRTN